jgi:hypothetical protein
VLPVALAACVLAMWSMGAARPANPLAKGRWKAAAAVSVVSAIAIAALFYSSFFTQPGALLEPFRGAGTYLNRGLAPASHAHPWHYYLGLLTYHTSGGLRWTEGLIVVLAIVGALGAWRRPDFWARYFTCYVAVAAAIFSIIPYKTPWNLLPFYAGAIVLAGIGFSQLLRSISSRPLAVALVASCLAASIHLGWQAWRASIVYAADSRNPYVYAQTVPDAVRMATRILELAAIHPDGTRMQVSVIASPYEQWPMPWYLRTLPNVGYWTAPGDPLAMQAPVIVVSMEHTAFFDALGDRYESEFFGLRPEVLLALYVDHGLWERYLAKVSGDPSSGTCLADAPSGIARCEHAPAVALWRVTVPFTPRGGLFPTP